MAGHILSAGHPLHVHNRTRAKADPLIARGAVRHNHPGDAAAAAKIVISIVGLPQDVKQIYLGDSGVVTRFKPGTILIDMTTSSPSLAVRIAAAAKARGLDALDVPSGGDIGARDAKLSIMVGGSESAFEAVLPILRRASWT
jgi:3-hydroxyisobutyrate dehydrogenase